MSFLRPVKVGDEVSLYATVLGTGRTSVRVSVEAWRRPRIGEMSKVTQAVFVFVAIGDDGRPRPVDTPA
jgi:acyl-CoA thioesterase YciA